jgi:hypothetical protein
MTNLLFLPHLMFLCEPMTPRRMKLQSQLEPKIIPSSKEKVDDLSPSLVQPPPPTSPPNGPLHLEQPGLDTVLHPPPKGIVQKSSFNPCATQNYNIVEDLA